MSSHTVRWLCLLEAKLFRLCDGNILSLKFVIQTTFFFHHHSDLFSLSSNTSAPPWPPPVHGPSANGIWKVYPNSWAFDVGFATWFSYWLFKIISTTYFNHGIWFAVCTWGCSLARWVSAFSHPMRMGHRKGEDGLGNPAEAWVEEDER